MQTRFRGLVLQIDFWTEFSHHYDHFEMRFFKLDTSYNILSIFWDTLRFLVHLTPCKIDITKAPLVRSIFEI